MAIEMKSYCFMRCVSAKIILLLIVGCSGVGGNGGDEFAKLKKLVDISNSNTYSSLEFDSCTLKQWHSNKVGMFSSVLQSYLEVDLTSMIIEKTNPNFSRGWISVVMDRDHKAENIFLTVSGGEVGVDALKKRLASWRPENNEPLKGLDVQSGREARGIIIPNEYKSDSKEILAAFLDLAKACK